MKIKILLLFCVLLTSGNAYNFPLRSNNQGSISDSTSILLKQDPSSPAAAPKPTDGEAEAEAELASLTLTSDVCSPTCQHGGVCVDGRCFCSNSYVGKSCEIEISENNRVNKYAFIFFCIVAFSIGIVLAIAFRMLYDHFFNYEDETSIVKRREVWRMG